MGIEDFDKRKQKYLTLILRKIKHASRRLENCRNDLEKCLNWEFFYHQAELFQANLFRIHKGMAEMIVDDWLEEGKKIKLTLDPSLKPFEQVKKMFKQSKKLKAAFPHLKKQIDLRVKSCELLRADLKALEVIDSNAELEKWIRVYFKDQTSSSRKEKDSKGISLPYHEFFSFSGMPIRVGKGAKSNQELTFRYSKGSDWWFHVRDYPGSHVVLCVKKGQIPDRESVYDAMLLAHAYSKIREEKEAEITVAQCKFVNKFPGGPPGKVQISKHKIMLVRCDKERLDLIKNRKSIHHPHPQSGIQHL